jgi:hypothetical protein
MRIGGRIRVAALLSGAAAAALMVAGCGGSKDFADKPRPAAAITLTGTIKDSGVSVSPSRVGAGPVVIMISNQTQSSHTLTLDGGDIAPVRTGPINPADTGQIKRTLAPGSYVVKAGSEKAVSREIPPAHLLIGKARPSSNDQLELP